jgi:hypothetical protein
LGTSAHLAVSVDGQLAYDPSAMQTAVAEWFSEWRATLPAEFHALRGEARRTPGDRQHGRWSVVLELEIPRELDADDVLSRLRDALEQDRTLGNRVADAELRDETPGDPDDAPRLHLLWLSVKSRHASR